MRTSKPHKANLPRRKFLRFLAFFSFTNFISVFYKIKKAFAGTTTLALSGTASGFVVTDPYFSSVTLLMHMDGSNGSTTFTDNSSSPKSLSVSGSVSLSNATSKFGGTCLNLTANGTTNYDNYIKMANYDNAFVFGTSDFTVETFVYIAGMSAQDPSSNRSATIICYFPTGEEIGWMFHIGGNTTKTGLSLGFIYSATGATSSPSWYGAVSGNYDFNYSQWYHIAASRSGGTTYIFVNGVLITSGSLPDNNIVCTTNCRLNIGERPWGNNYKFPLNGYVDEVRITKGVARYTANFTPPSVPFLNA